MRIVVTGAAGFIGSTIAIEAVSRGHEVIGIDSITDYYDPALKLRNLGLLAGLDGFRFVRGDLRDPGLEALLDGTDAVLHQAGQPGVRTSWDDLGSYVDNNIQATNALLIACRRAYVPKVIYASSSSVYGNAKQFPVPETAYPEPFSPYGVTKLAAENLVRAYASNFGLRTLSLRYFTVYGPRQRPDMAIQRMLTAIRDNAEFGLFGDGSQVRDFTYVGDIARANVLAAEGDRWEPGAILNLAGGTEVTMNELIEQVGSTAGRRLNVKRSASHAGDVRRTGGDTTAAAALLNWYPRVRLAEGLAAQWEWFRDAQRQAA